MPILWRDDDDRTPPSRGETLLAGMILLAGAVLVLGGFMYW